MREKWIVWCELNDEQDALAKELGGDCVSVFGSLSPEEKVARERRWREEDVPVMLTKCSVFGWGMNWQHCSKMIFLGASHSYEQTYQAVRRCWRFGQTRPVDVFIIRAETEGAIVENFRRKEADAERMAGEMGSRMRDVMRAEVLGATREWNSYEPRKAFAFPEWVRESA
jgi:superfamily II DNA helicase RecQ